MKMHDSPLGQADINRIPGVDTSPTRKRGNPFRPSLASFEVTHSAVFVRQRRCVPQPRVAQLPWVRSPEFPRLPQRGCVRAVSRRDETPLGYGRNGYAAASQGSRCAATPGCETQPLRGTPCRTTPECATSKLARRAGAGTSYLSACLVLATAVLVSSSVQATDVAFWNEYRPDKDDADLSSTRRALVQAATRCRQVTGE